MIEGYQINKPLFTSSNTTYLDTIEEKSGEKRIIELIDDEQVSLAELAELKNDFEISGRGDIDGILRSIKLEKYLSGIALIKEYYKGVSLGEYLSHNNDHLLQKILIAEQLAEIFRDLHKARFVHRDIHPNAFMIDLDYKTVKLVNLRKASSLAIERIHTNEAGEISGMLHYISPEQTGRMNRSIDYRTDIYSLGVLFYKLFCNELPFDSKNALELIYSHIAKLPLPPSEKNEEIPEALSNIILKMIRKNAEDRYQSMQGILEDLNICLKRLRQSGTIEPFEIGKRDRTAVFNISEKLYGRDHERTLLIESFQKAKDDIIDLVLVTGYSGIGKTRLINEIYKPLAAENGNFISGKFEQYSQNNPYRAFAQAIRSRVRQILASDSEEFHWWKQRIQDALGENGRILVELIPELETIIGGQPDVIELGLAESQVRFLEVFEQCLGALASREKPLVLFIDDLQWADSGSLEIIYNILVNRHVRHILLIGAYRDNEVGLSHPLSLMLNRLEEKVTKIEFIHLSELKPDEANQLLADSLRLDPEKTHPVADLIMSKTGGNPFFINQFLHNLVQEDHIYFDDEDECWRWNLEAIRNMNITDNVVDLLISKLKSLHPETQEVLSQASAIGIGFDLQTLTSLSNRNSESIAEALWEAVSKDFIQATDQRSKHLTDELWQEIGIDGVEKSKISFKFQHDKIQQAAYSMMSEDKRQLIHLKVGRHQLDRLSKEELSDNIFEVAGHFNKSLNRLENEKEMLHVAKLNLRAGEQAKKSNSYESSLKFLRNGMRITSPERAPTLYRKFLISRSECEYLCGHYEESERMYDIALENASGQIEQAKVFADRMTLYENTSRNSKAIQSALMGLRLLGIKLPEKPGMISIFYNLLKAKYSLYWKSIDDLKAQENIDSPKLILSMKIMVNLWGPAYLSNTNLLVLAILKMVILSVRHGNAPESALAYAFYGFMNCAQLKDFDKGYEFGKLGLWLNEKYDDKTLRSKVYVIFAGCIAHWTVHLKDTLELLRSAHEAGIESNDLVYAGYALNFTGKNIFFQSDPLDSVITKVKSFVDFGRKIKSKVTLHHLLTVARISYRFAGLAPDEQCFGDSLDETEHHEQIEQLADEDGITLPLASNLIYQAYGDYFFGQYEEALQKTERSMDVLDAMLGLIDQAIHHFVHSATLLALARQNPSQWKSKAVKRAKKNQKLFKKWAESCPENWESMYLLVEAELASVQGEEQRAGSLYNRAKESAEQAGLIQYVALINEKLADWFERTGFRDASLLMRRMAYLNYSHWGAQAKVEQIKKQFPDLESIKSVQNAPDQNLSGYESMSSSTLDLQSIFKASTSISGEVEFEKLLEKLLHTVLENAGAQKGVIMTVKNNELRVMASSSVEEPGVEIKGEVPVQEAKGIPRSMIQFGYHSAQPIIVENPVSDNRFSSDPYFMEVEPRSALCQPIIHSGQTIAMIYLENKTTEGAFTPARLEILNLLSGQIAVSLQNADLYRSQQNLNEAYQRFVPLDFINAIGRDSILDVRLGDSIRDEMTVMFCDIRSYTTLSEGLNPKESFHLINDYLSMVGPVIIQNDGFINHYLGDGFIALFKNSAEDALRASIEMFEKMDQYNRDRYRSGDDPLRFGIGLHKGPVMMGIIGDQKRHDANVISDAVNISSRLENMTKTFSAHILTSTQTVQSIEDQSFFTGRKLGSYRLKGKEDAIELVEIIDVDAPEIRDKKINTMESYHLGLSHFTKGKLEEAEGHFRRVLEQHPDDLISRRFLNRIESFKTSDRKGQWDPTETITQ